MLDDEMDGFGLGCGIDGDENRTSGFTMEKTAVEADECDALRTDLLCVTGGLHEIGGKTFAAVDGNGEHDILIREQAAHLVDEHFGAIRVVGPRSVERDIIGEAAGVERALAVRDDVFGKVTGKMLRGGSGAAVADGV